MKKGALLCVLIIGLIQTGFAAFQPHELLFVPWGNESTQLPLTETPSGWVSVESFSVIDNNVHLLVSNTGQIRSFSDQKLVSTLETGIRDAKDILFDENNELTYLMSSDLIYQYHRQTTSIFWVNPWKMRPNSRFIASNQKTPRILLGLSETIIPDSPHPILTKGSVNHLNQDCQVVRRSDSEMALLINKHQIALLIPDRGTWGSGQYLGTTPDNLHYLLLEVILEQYPLVIEREIRVINDQGISIAALEVPAIIYTPVSREFQLEPDGSFYELITAEDGAHVIHWEFSENHPSHFEKANLLEKFRHIQVIDFSGDQTLPLPAEQDEKSAGSMIDRSLLDFPPVERDSILNKADEYVDLIWTATSANLTNGQINDPAGNSVQTPDWVQIGQNQKMAYQWGGFSTIDGFVDGLASGKYAGDMATSAVSAYAVGVDCSGFVSRCWNMPSHYSTWMMSNTQPLITQPYESWYDLRPGDAIHKVGHVRLLVLWNSNGTMLAVEAGGGWITHYQSYSISQLADYQPRYYINTLGMPATIQQPELSGVNNADSSLITWSLIDTSSVQGLHLYWKDIFQNDDWILEPNTLLQPEVNHYSFPRTNLCSAYQLRSVGSDEAESYPSDAYALTDRGTAEKLLIVDGFDRTTGSYPFPYHDFSLRMAEALGRFTFSFETVSNDAILANNIALEDYTAVFWLLGDESTLDETFSDAEQAYVETYLSQGGKLFVSGSELAWDLDSQGPASDQAFIHNYLKAAYNADDSESYTINGVTGTPFATVTLNYDDGNDGVYEENYPDAFNLSGGSEAVLRYANNLIAATAYTGTFGNGTAPGQVVVLGIPFETIYEEDQRLSLVTALMDYFGLSTVLPITSASSIPDTRLLAPYPTPFNSTSQIRFQVSTPGLVDLRIFDLRGREITQLTHTFYPVGTWQLPFNGEGLPGGIYLVRMQSGKYTDTRKIIYLK